MPELSHLIDIRFQAYIDAHPSNFAGGREGTAARNYRRNWVANYELSDMLAAVALEEAADSGAPSFATGVAFSRHNQVGCACSFE